MNCKIKRLLAFLLFCAAGYLAVAYVPPERGGHGAMVLFILIFGGLFFWWIISALGIGRNPYQGAQNLRRQARKVATHDGIDINTAIQEVWDQAKAKGETYPKRELDTLPRPVLVDRAHMDHIRHNETIPPPDSVPLPGYDHPVALALPTVRHVAQLPPLMERMAHPEIRYEVTEEFHKIEKH